MLGDRYIESNICLMCWYFKGVEKKPIIVLKFVALVLFYLIIKIADMRHTLTYIVMHTTVLHSQIINNSINDLNITLYHSCQSLNYKNSKTYVLIANIVLQYVATEKEITTTQGRINS